MVQAKITPEGVDDVQAAIDKMIVALDTAQPDALRYASLLQPDGETFVALRQVEDGAENPLEALPEYKEMLEIVEGVRAAPPVVQMWNVAGSYRLF
jgi:hypothetical protein